MTDIVEYLKKLNINLEGTETDNGVYVIDLQDSNEYGRIYSKLENAEDLDLMEENMVITEQGSSLIYESDSEPYLLNLIGDFDSDRYQLIINKVE